jgi:glutathione S-transferase
MRLVLRDHLGVARLFHIACEVDWERATADGAYRVSTLERRLEEVGYIHLSFAHQVKQVADALYRGRDDLLLLEIDSARLRWPLVVEDLDGSGERFPHVYGELNLDAVQGARPLRPRRDGTFDAVTDTAP